MSSDYFKILRNLQPELIAIFLRNSRLITTQHTKYWHQKQSHHHTLYNLTLTISSVWQALRMEIILNVKSSVLKRKILPHISLQTALFNTPWKILPLLPTDQLFVSH